MLYNFQKRFAPLVKRGRKRQTIRAERRDGRVPKPGEILHLYTGLRTKAAMLLRLEPCRKVTRITMMSNSAMFCVILGDPDLCVGLTVPELEKLARADGFADWKDMHAWFLKTHGDQFRGYLIEW